MQKKLATFIESESGEFKDDLFVHLTIYDVPASLLKEFCEKIVKPYYPDGISQAIKDLMRKAAAAQESAQTHHKQNECEKNG